MTAKFPEIGCSYIAPDQCTGFTPANCCERIKKFNDGNNNNKSDTDKDDDDKDEDTDGGVVVMTSMALLLVLSSLAVVL